MLAKSLDALTASDIENLVRDGVREGRSLEYKQSLPGSADDDKREFLADVSSCANASGGDLIYGLSEARTNGDSTGTPNEVVGVGAVNIDAEIRRLEAIASDGIEPRVQMRVRAIQVDERTVIVIRILSSWAGPHMVTFKNLSRFYSRSSAGKRQLDVTEIRAAFALSESLSERLKRFRDERLARIAADETPVQLSAPRRLILHFVPASSFEPAARLDVTQVEPSMLPPIHYGNGWNHRLNFDGLLTYSQLSDRTYHTYTQLFRSGAVEAVEAFMLRREVGREDLIPSALYERELISAAQAYLRLAGQLELGLPWFLMVTLMGVKGMAMAVRPLEMVDTHPLDRDLLVLPDTMSDDANASAETVLKPAFDAAWQACGIRRSLNYNTEGRWVGQR